MWPRTAALLLILKLVSRCHCTSNARPQVLTPLGPIEGVWMTSELGTSYAAFLGVPFAQPPLGKLRFQLAQPVQPWKGIWDASTIAPQCLTWDHRMHPMDNQAIKGYEDCLYLNIYSPVKKEDKKAPVVVFIHAGAFMFGTSNQYGAKFLADRGVVLVTINYRVGPLGFLSFGDDVLPGNNGLKDQVEALRWVKRHIELFGGDPDNVTLVGLSAGGSSVHFHYLSPLSRGLFSQGVSMSGTAMCRWALAENMREKSLQIATSLGCGQNDSRQILDCLRERPAQNIVAQVEHLQVWQYTPFSPLGPVVEGNSNAAFLPEAPIKMLESGNFAHLPWVTGVTGAEGLYPSATFVAKEHEIAKFDAEFDRLAPFLLDFNYTVASGEQMASVVNAIRTEYFGQDKIDSSKVRQIVQMISDRLFLVDAQKAAEVQAASSKAPVWFYYFTFRGEHSLSDLMTGTKNDYGASHADDVSYFLNVTFIPQEKPRTGADAQVQTQMLDIWTSFVKSGNPAEGIVWEKVEPQGPLKYLLVDAAPSKMAQTDDLGNGKFWQSLPFQEEDQRTASSFSQSIKDEL
ncbi:venom carboxylesterase-6-like isoform X2 [Neocloeon triangulifer]|uniref:venom carboxylesterase-6-like isoform X2 n=1 Tax=Neocloeon triangulifer TaxID=2078957 RepID=UPI00286F8285|nr:venom carboxylesterase-6-like isoform X2 [Neocloeon triangulifer]